jgi:hypothetical protein
MLQLPAALNALLVSISALHLTARLSDSSAPAAVSMDGALRVLRQLAVASVSDGMDLFFGSPVAQLHMLRACVQNCGESPTAAQNLVSRVELSSTDATFRRSFVQYFISSPSAIRRLIRGVSDAIVSELRAPAASPSPVDGATGSTAAPAMTSPTADSDAMPWLRDLGDGASCELLRVAKVHTRVMGSSLVRGLMALLSELVACSAARTLQQTRAVTSPSQQSSTSSSSSRRSVQRTTGEPVAADAAANVCCDVIDVCMRSRSVRVCGGDDGASDSCLRRSRVYDSWRRGLQRECRVGGPAAHHPADRAAAAGLSHAQRHRRCDGRRG